MDSTTTLVRPGVRDALLENITLHKSHQANGTRKQIGSPRMIQISFLLASAHQNVGQAGTTRKGADTAVKGALEGNTMTRELRGTARFAHSTLMMTCQILQMD